MSARTALLERGEELGEIERLVDAAIRGEGGVLSIEGEAGAGKTSLLEAAAEVARAEGLTVLRARGGEHERDFPYGVIRQLLEPQLADPGRRAELLEGAAALAGPVFEADPALSSAAEPLGAQHGLYWMVADIAARTPLALLVDDAQWADETSLRVLLYVARRLEGIPAALILTVRTGEPDTRVEIADELRRVDGAQLIAPASLSPAAGLELISGHLEQAPAPRFAEACQRASAGNPFLAVELMRGLRSEQIEPTDENAERVDGFAAAGVTRSIQARLLRLGEAEVEVARAVAILEPNAAPEHVAALSGVEPKQAAEASARLIEAGLLSEGREPGFVHPLVRNAVYSDMREPRRAMLHGKAAELLRAAGAEPDSIAAHLLLAQPREDAEVVKTLRAAAAAAIARAAPAAAVTYLRRALREQPGEVERREIEVAIGTALLVDDREEGADHLLAMRAASGDPVFRAQMSAKIAESLGIRDRTEEANTILTESFEEVGAGSELRLSLLTEQVKLAYSGGRAVDLGEVLETIDRVDGGTRDGRLFLSCSGHLIAIGGGRAEKALEAVDRSIADPVTYLKDAEDGYPGWSALSALAVVGQSDRARVRYEEVAPALLRRGTTVGRGIGGVLTGLIAYLRGELLDSQVDSRLSLDAFESVETPVGARFAAALMLRVLVERGEWAEAESLAESRHLFDRGTGVAGAYLLYSRGELRLARAAPGEARADFTAVREEVGWLPHPDPELLGWRIGLARAEAALGNGEQAARLAAEGVLHARGASSRRGLGVALRAQGALAEGEEGIAILREALDVLGPTDARLQHAHALVDIGAALRRANRRKEAREPLREGLDMAHRCGATPLEERAQTELEATGARPRSVVLSGVESLTPSELRVARLAAEGKTNREIAQALFVTAKTIETHLRHVYQKLDVERAGLAAVVSSG